MSEQSAPDGIERLEPLIGEWQMHAAFPGGAPVDAQAQDAGHTVFEWLVGRQFVLQRWEVPHPAAPDGIAIIGPKPGGNAYLQHYFDSRGVARLYEMTLAEGVWKLWRTQPDVSPLDFSQRYTGTLSSDGTTIHGSWESSSDGSTWAHDFELIYTRVS